MIGSLLQHKCDIYHLVEVGENVGYGLPQDKGFSYPSTPDIVGAKCYYYLAQNVMQRNQPDSEYDLVYKVIFLTSEDVRVNDKVIIGAFEFILDVPDRKLDSHIEVLARRVRTSWQR